MKTTFFRIAGILLLVTGLIFTGCKKDSKSTPIDIQSIMCGTIDLYGPNKATNVDVINDIAIVFTTDVDQTTAQTAIQLKRGTVSVATQITVSGPNVTIHPTDNLITGTEYTLTFDGVKSTGGEILTTISVPFLTKGVGLDTPPQASSQTLYLQFNGNISDVTGNATKEFEQVAYTTDRFGNANGAADFRGATIAGNGDIVELSGTKFINPSTTISVWFKVNPADYSASKVMFGLGTERGFFNEISPNDGWLKFATSHKVSPDPNNHYFGTAWTDPNGSGTHAGALAEYVGSITNLIGSSWHQLVMTYDANSQVKTIYIDGIIMLQVSLNNPPEWILTDFAIADKTDGTGTPVTGIDPKLALGFFCSRDNTATGWSTYSTATNTYKGALDDMRIFSKALSTNEVTQLYNAEKPSAKK
ncbi:MAG TPA: Ig-like domain-containing protein [Bacteroidales bacterium]|nr:Ig-like domain-containing protein [Bacteroidales bacterium]